jgi:hypothetical protein
MPQSECLHIFKKKKKKKKKIQLEPLILVSKTGVLQNTCSSSGFLISDNLPNLQNNEPVINE